MNTISVTDLPKGITIRYEPFSDKFLTVETVKHHKTMGTVTVSGIDDEGQPITLRFLDGIEFCV